MIDKWLTVGVVEDGQWTECDEGSPQGASVSPLLANIYLHYVLDLWVAWWRDHHAHGDVIIVRWADDFVVGFEDEQDARQFLAELRERFAKFGLELHPDKTRLIEFGRHAAWKRRRRGAGKPETFDFLGFTHICATNRAGRFWIKRITIAKRMRAKLAEIKIELKRRWHHPIPEQGQWLASVLRGHYAYYAVPGNSDAVNDLPVPGDRALAQAATAPQPAGPVELGPDETDRESMATATTRDASLPGGALRRQNLRQEPSAVVPHAGICAGGRPQGRSLPRLVSPPRDRPIASRLGLPTRPADPPPGGSGSSPDFLSFDPPPCVQLGRRDDLRGDVGGQFVAATGGVLMGADHRAVHPDRPVRAFGHVGAAARNSSRTSTRVPSPDQRRCRF